MEKNNIINILKEALKFYADENNYCDIRNLKSMSGIEMDCGNHARFALEQVEKIEKIMNDAEAEFVKNLSNKIEANVNGDELINLIEKYKNDNRI